MSTTPHTIRTRILDSAETLFGEHGLTAIPLVDITQQAGVTRTEFEGQFATKNNLIEAVLDARHDGWMTRLKTELDAYSSSEDKLLAIFTFLEHWFAEETFHRCAFVTSYGELGPATGWVDVMIRRHKTTFDTLVASLAEEAALPASIAASIALLADGAQVSAAVTGNIKAARDARSSAAVLIAMYRTEPRDIIF